MNQVKIKLMPFRYTVDWQRFSYIFFRLFLSLNSIPFKWQLHAFKGMHFQRNTIQFSALSHNGILCAQWSKALVDFKWHAVALDVQPVERLVNSYKQRATFSSLEKASYIELNTTQIELYSTQSHSVQTHSVRHLLTGKLLNPIPLNTILLNPFAPLITELWSMASVFQPQLQCLYFQHTKSHDLLGWLRDFIRPKPKWI